MKTLVKVARDIYPHDFLGDVYYITAVKPWNDKAAAKGPAVKAMLVGGVQRLDADARDRHKVAYIDVDWEEDRVALLRGIEQTEFFKTLRVRPRSVALQPAGSVARSSATKARPPRRAATCIAGSTTSPGCPKAEIRERRKVFGSSEESHGHI